MSTRRISTTNTTAVYLIVSVVIVSAFLLLGGGSWIKGMINGNSSMGIVHLNWAQILISLVIGFLLGFIVARRKW